MEYFFLILPFLILLALFLRSFTVLIHELGHAIPAAIFTRASVTIFLGSYGEKTKSCSIKLGLMEFSLKRNPLLWQRGICIPSPVKISVNRQIFYIMMGPAASLFIFSVACYLLYMMELPGVAKLILVILAGSSLFDFLVSVIPINYNRSFAGNVAGNDAFLIKKLLYYKNFEKKYAIAANFYQQQQYRKSAILFAEMLSMGQRHDVIYRLAISCNNQIGNYYQAKLLSDELILLGKMDSDDYVRAAFSYSRLNLINDAIHMCDKSLELNSVNKYALNSKAYFLISQCDYGQAINLVNKAIEVDPTFVEAFDTRGLAKIKMGHGEEGLIDIQHSIKLDPFNSSSFRSLGIYYLEKGERKEALELFKKAKTLNPRTEAINELIQQAKRKSKNN